MFVCCIWDEACILDDRNLNFHLHLVVFCLHKNSSFLPFLHNDTINWLNRRGTILFSHPVMVKQSICKAKTRFSKQSSMSQCPYLLISHTAIAALISNNFSPLLDWNPTFSAVRYINKSCVCILSSSVSPAWDAFFAGHLRSNPACFQITTLSNYPVYFILYISTDF